MKGNIVIITWLCAIPAFTALAQESTNTTTGTNSSPAPTPYVRPWKGLELIAHQCFTDAEDIEHHRVYIQAQKEPEVIAASKAWMTARLAAMRKFDPSLAPVLAKYEEDRKTMNDRDVLARMTPEEKARYDKAFNQALKDPDVQAAAKVYGATKDAVMNAINPACAEWNKRLEAAYDAARKDYYNKNTPAEPQANKTPAASNPPN